MRSRGFPVAVMAVVAIVALLDRGVLRAARGEHGLERHAHGEQQDEKRSKQRVLHSKDSYSIPA